MERILEPAELKRACEQLLGLSTMTLATSGEDGEAHAADVYFASDEHLSLHFFSAADNQHSQDIHRDPRAAVTIHAVQEGWEHILGLQMRGVLTQISSKVEWQLAWEYYLAKFPFVSDLEELVKMNQLYRFIPKWIRLVDNSQGLGFKQEWQLKITQQDGGEVPLWVQQTGEHEKLRRADG